jgi:hypothetical protein
LLSSGYRGRLLDQPLEVAWFEAVSKRLPDRLADHHPRPHAKRVDHRGLMDQGARIARNALANCLDRKVHLIGGWSETPLSTHQRIGEERE